jgi:hypothetical protein
MGAAIAALRAASRPEKERPAQRLAFEIGGVQFTTEQLAIGANK